MNIIDPFLCHARHQPMAPAVCAPGTHFNIVSYGRLELFVNNIAARAAALGLKPGDTVALFVKDLILHLALILGLTRIGVITLSAASSGLPGEFAIDAVIADAAAPFRNAKRVILADRAWTDGGGVAPPAGGENGRGGGTAPTWWPPMAPARAVRSPPPRRTASPISGELSVFWHRGSARKR